MDRPAIDQGHQQAPLLAPRSEAGVNRSAFPIIVVLAFRNCSCAVRSKTAGMRDFATCVLQLAGSSIQPLERRRSVGCCARRATQEKRRPRSAAFVAAASPQALRPRSRTAILRPGNNAYGFWSDRRLVTSFWDRCELSRLKEFTIRALISQRLGSTVLNLPVSHRVPCPFREQCCLPEHKELAS